MIFINKRLSYVLASKFPIAKVISSKVVNNTPITKEIYSNYNLENPIVKRYNQKTYQDGDLTLDSNSSTNCVYDSYFFCDNITHSGTFQTKTSQYGFDDFGGSRKTKEFPYPVTLRTDNGKVVKFYQNNDFTTPVYEVDCLRAIREKRGSDTEKTWYWDDWSRITRVYNLVPGETYQYKVFDANNQLITGIYKKNTSYGEFKTKGQIRTIRLIGVVNARDSGGYLTVDGTKRVKYGKLFRGAQFSRGFFNNNTTGAYNTNAKRRWVNGADTNTFYKAMGGLDDVGVKEVQRLGITKDIDLRDPSANESSINTYGESSDFRHFIVDNTDGITVNRESISDNITIDGQIVNDGISYASIAKINSTKNGLDYHGTNLQSYEGMFITNNTQTQDNGKRQFVTFIEEVISGLEHRDANDNPRNDGAIYVHCQQGRDRTGTFIACLFALLGVNDNGIIKDYELTTTTDSTTTRWHLQGSKAGKVTFPAGSNVREYVYNWATTDSPTGQQVTTAQINKLKELLLEDIPEEDEEEEAPIRYETYSVENPIVSNYLNTTHHSANQLVKKASTVNDYSIYAPDIQEYTENGITYNAGPSYTWLKNQQLAKGYKYDSYRDPHFIATDYHIGAKPNYFELENPNIVSVDITDTVTNKTYTVANRSASTTSVTAYFGGGDDSSLGGNKDSIYAVNYEAFPVIGSSTFINVLDRLKPFFTKGSVPSSSYAVKYAIPLSTSYSTASPAYATAESSRVSVNGSKVPVFTYDGANTDWSVWNVLSTGATLKAPKEYKAALYSADKTFIKFYTFYAPLLHTNGPTKIWNLIPGRIYHYQAKDANARILEEGNIKPTGTLRSLFFEGIRNVRDLGGWTCYDSQGKAVGYIKYDRLYRGSRPEVTSTDVRRPGGVTINDRYMMKDFINLGRELDLRESDSGDNGNYYMGSSTTNSPFSINTSTGKIPRVRQSCASYWKAFDCIRWNEGDEPNAIKSHFICLGYIIDSLKKNESIYFHCAQGADRTAAIAMTVESLVGINDDQLLKDWELTSFSGGCYNDDVHGTVSNESDYRAMNNECDDPNRSAGSGTHELVHLVQLKEFLQQVYGQSTMSANIVQWFKTVCTYQVKNLTSANFIFLNEIGFREQYKKDKGENTAIVSSSGKTIASSVESSYLGLINSTASTSFTNADQVIDYLKWKLVDYTIVKTMAVLGDSQSAYRNDDRCPLQDLWWYKFAQSIGLNPETDVNNSSIGNTMVARQYDNKDNMGCSWSRINNLKVNGKDPDIIFVMMGGNDWVNSSISLGTYTNGDTLPGDSSTPENLDFKPAFALMLSRIKKTYQNSLVVCINEPRVTNATVTGHDWDEWMYAQIEVAKDFNCPVIDLCHICGNVIKDTLQSDNTSIYKSDQYVHLNALGHELIANVIK